MEKSRKRLRPRVQLVCKDASLTRQSERDSCDINVILERFNATGILPPGTVREGFYADVSELGGYREVIDRVKEAERYFMTLPGEIRETFANDPARFLDFATEEGNRPQLEKWGLMEAPEGAVKAPSEPQEPSSAAKGTGS